MLLKFCCKFNFCIKHLILNTRNELIQNINIEGITIVRSKEDAIKAVNVLKQHGNKICAWDTEIIGLDPKVESPVGKGDLLCATAFCGPEVNFGNLILLISYLQGMGLDCLLIITLKTKTIYCISKNISKIKIIKKYGIIMEWIDILSIILELTLKGLQETQLIWLDQRIQINWQINTLFHCNNFN